MPIIDLVGQRFGRLLVLEKAEKSKNDHSNRSQWWKCVCDCGKIININSHSLRNGNSKSCGCLQKDIVAIIGKANKGIKRPSQSVGYGLAAFNAVYEKYKRRANQRGFVFLITKEEFDGLTKQKCFYCNKKPAQMKKEIFYNGVFVYNGIDRIDSKQGYTSDNVVPCCGGCNRRKSDKDKSFFYKLISDIYKHHFEHKL